jgi:Rieske 2Fe-2S family protein
VPGEPAASGENYPSSGSWIGGWMSLRDGAATMSLDGHSGGVPLRGLSGDQLRTVVFLAIFPNVLLSLHQSRRSSPMPWGVPPSRTSFRARHEH